jgi:hypothetical protein
MDIGNTLQLLRCLSPKLIPQQTIHSHLSPSLNAPRLLQRLLQHLLRLSNLVHYPILKCLLSRPLVRLEQHLARDLRPEFETGEESYTGEVETEVDGRHAEETAGGVHDAVVMGEGEGASATECVSS